MTQDRGPTFAGLENAKARTRKDCLVFDGSGRTRVILSLSKDAGSIGAVEFI